MANLEDKYNALLKFVRKAAAGYKDYIAEDPDDYYMGQAEAGNSDDTFWGGVAQGHHDVGVEAREVLESIGEPIT